MPAWMPALFAQRTRAAGPAVLLGLLGLVVCDGSAQTVFCRSALQARPGIQADSEYGAIVRAYPILQSLDTLTLMSQVAMRVRRDRVLPLAYYQDSIPAPSFEPRVAQDTAFARATAVILTRLMSGFDRGLSDDQGSAAAELYRQWRLPPGPALVLLRASWSSPLSKYWALRATTPYWADSSLHDAGVAALCFLAARSAGVASWLGLSDTADVRLVTDNDEWGLLYALTQALSRNRQSAARWVPLRQLLPAANPVSANIRYYAADLW